MERLSGVLLNNKNSNFLLFIFKFFLFFLLLSSIFTRSFMGVYLFQLRIGEYIVGFGLFFLLFVLFLYPKYKKELGSKIVNAYLLIVFLFFLNLLNDFSSPISSYIFKSSSYIWYISYFFLGFILFSEVQMKIKYLYFSYFALFVVYFLNTIYYPVVLQNFFLEYSDKFQFSKASEISIFYICVTFFSNRIYTQQKLFDLFVITSSLILPLVIFKSRSGAIAIILYFIFEIWQKRKTVETNLKRNVILGFIFAILFSLTSHNLVDNIYTIDETEQAIAGIFTHKYLYSNTYDGEMPLFYIAENRLFSADGNLNWRLQLWQEGIHSTIAEKKLILGFGFRDIIPIFNDINFSTIDKSNTNAHNFILNVFFSGGLVTLFAIFVFFYFVVMNKNVLQQTLSFTSFLLPLFFISMFDGSMENPYFGMMFYLFLSLFFIDINKVKAKSL